MKDLREKIATMLIPYMRYSERMSFSGELISLFRQEMIDELEKLKFPSFQLKTTEQLNLRITKRQQKLRKKEGVE